LVGRVDRLGTLGESQPEAGCNVYQTSHQGNRRAHLRFEVGLYCDRRMSLRNLDVPTVAYCESLFSHSLSRGRSVAAHLKGVSTVCIRTSMPSVRSVVGCTRRKTYSTTIVTTTPRTTTPANHSVFSIRVFTLTAVLSHREMAPNTAKPKGAAIP
jgi:hypothetical protein